MIRLASSKGVGRCVSIGSRGFWSVLVFDGSVWRTLKKKSMNLKCSFYDFFEVLPHGTQTFFVRFVRLRPIPLFVTDRVGRAEAPSSIRGAKLHIRTCIFCTVSSLWNLATCCNRLTKYLRSTNTYFAEPNSQPVKSHFVLQRFTELYEFVMCLFVARSVLALAT